MTKSRDKETMEDIDRSKGSISVLWPCVVCSRLTQSTLILPASSAMSLGRKLSVSMVGMRNLVRMIQRRLYCTSSYVEEWWDLEQMTDPQNGVLAELLMGWAGDVVVVESVAMGWGTAALTTARRCHLWFV